MNFLFWNVELRRIIYLFIRLYLDFYIDIKAYIFNYMAFICHIGG